MSQDYRLYCGLYRVDRFPLKPDDDAHPYRLNEPSDLSDLNSV